MPSNNPSLDNGSRRSRYSKGTTPLPPLPMPMSAMPMSLMQQHHQHHHQQQMPTMRTPVAWNLRDANLSRPASAVPFGAGSFSATMQHHPPPSHHLQHRYQQSVMSTTQHHPGQGARPSSPSATTETSSDDREERPMVRGSRRPSSHMRGNTSDRRSVMSRASRQPSHMHGPAGPMPPYELVAYGPGPHGQPHSFHHLPTGTLRSSRSVPALAFAAAYEGGPGCPVHGGHPGHPGHPHHHMPPQYAMQHPGAYNQQEPSPLRRFGSMIDVRSLPPSAHIVNQYPMMSYAPEKKFLPYGPSGPSIITLPRQPVYQQRPVMMTSYGETMARDHFKHATPAPSAHKLKSRPDVYDETVCCKGHLIVLWIILGVVTLGVISGIVLGVTMN